MFAGFSVKPTRLRRCPFRTELADLDEFEAERLDVSQYAVECRPIQEAGEYGLGALPP